MGECSEVQKFMNFRGIRACPGGVPRGVPILYPTLKSGVWLNIIKTDGIDGKNVNFEAGDRRSIEFYLKKLF